MMVVKVGKGRKSLGVLETVDVLITLFHKSWW
jgi:hypothetical protein